MKIALCSTYVPFLRGGGRNIVDWLAIELKKIGHQVEVVYLPQVDTADKLMKQAAIFRYVDLSAADRMICFRPFSYLFPHKHKILWFMHHIREYYDLWDSEYRPFPEIPQFYQIREALHSLDRLAFQEAKKIFTISKTVSNRLLHYNKLESEVLYPPILSPEKFHCKTYNDEIVYLCRIEHHKRQHLVVEAMRYTKTPVKLRLCGTSFSTQYSEMLTNLISEFNLADKVHFSNVWISEVEKIQILATCLATVYLPLDEDYGYPSLESFHSQKPVITAIDSGGALEFVQDKVNGFITEPDPKALAEMFDKLYLERANTIRMGKNALARIQELNICWSQVLERILK